MSFLAPILLFGLPLALVPVIIHLIHLLRRRQVKWAAMMFLRKAQKMNKGLSKLRQYLILALRMLAVAALIIALARPLAGGLLGLTGGAPDSVLVLLDRSASMEARLLSTGTSKRQAGLDNVRAAIEDAYGTRSKLVFIDSATLEPVVLENAQALAELPQTGPTETTADIPALMQEALDYMTANETGRTDVWLISDLRQNDWDPGGGRWAALRSAFSTLKGIRFHLLAYADEPAGDLGIVVENVERRATSSGAELLLDLRLRRHAGSGDPATVPVQAVVQGVTSRIDVDLKGSETLLQAVSIPIDGETKRGWGRVEIPADAVPANNAFHFVFDEPAPVKSVIVTDDAAASRALLAALTAPADPSRVYEAAVLPPDRAAEITWEETGLIVWQSPIPDPESALGKQLESHLRQGRRMLFLPPREAGEHAFARVRWTAWEDPGKAVLLDWWRSDTGLLGATRAGTALPVGETGIRRWRGLEGETVPLARLSETEQRALILARALGQGRESGTYFLTTLPGPDSSTLARDGVVLYALLHRALEEGMGSLGKAQHRAAGADVLGEQAAVWKQIGVEGDPRLSMDRALRAGVLEHPSGDLRMALNRPLGEDDPTTLGEPALEEIFSGLDWRLLERTLEDDKSLTSEIWRTFLILMAAALIFEALLCMPRKSASRPPSAERLEVGG